MLAPIYIYNIELFYYVKAQPRFNKICSVIPIDEKKLMTLLFIIVISYLVIVSILTIPVVNYEMRNN